MKLNQKIILILLVSYQLLCAGVAWLILGVSWFIVLPFFVPVIFMVVCSFRLEVRHKQHLEDLQQQVNESTRQLQDAREDLKRDPLTGLCSRAYLRSRLEEILKSSQKNRNLCAVLYLDIDFFKELNEALGHSTGNQLLIKVAERLRMLVRKSGLIGYYGGDEFMVILPQVNHLTGVELMAQKMIEVLAGHFEFQAQNISITVSIGISIGPTDGEDCETLLGRADAALKLSKSKGRKIYSFYSQQLNQIASERIKIDQLLRGALKRNEFRLHYQVVIAVEGNRVKGFEALIRWHNAELGSVSPDVFIPIAEQIGLISEIGNWVLREAVQQLKVWQLKYQKPIIMSVNVSPRQFQDQSILPALKSVVTQAGVPPSTIQLEVTEGLFLSASDQILNSIELIKGSGFLLALDDFGTGYSSLSYLNRLPFDVLKVDKVFIEGIANNDKDRKMVSAVIAIGHGLGMEIVVEGVESPQQIQHLKALGVDYLQGYYYSQPMDAREAEYRFLANETILELNETIWDRLP